MKCSITLVCSCALFANIQEAIDAASTLPPGVSHRALELLDIIIGRLGDWAVDGDLRPTTVADEFELTVVPQICRDDAMFLAALRAREIDTIVSHLPSAEQDADEDW
jgi:hypothetical protein